MRLKHALIALAFLVAVLGIPIAVHAATQNISCPATVVDTATQYTVTTTCKFPKPPPSTVTATTTATATATVTATVTASPSASPTASQTPTVTPTPTPTQPPATGFPTESTTGLPAGWTPAQTFNGLTVTTAGAVVQDVRVNGTLTVAAPNVTLRRVDVNGTIENGGSTCHNGLSISDSRVSTGTGRADPAIEVGGYTANNVLIYNSPEGFRVGGHEDIGCGAVTITNSFAHVVPPANCGDWHGDTLQGYDPANLTVRNSVLVFDESATCGGTGALTLTADPGTSVDIDGLIVKGGGYPVRLDTPGTVRNLHIVQASDWYGPIDVRCNRLTTWQAQIVTLNSAGQPVPVRVQPCNT